MFNKYIYILLLILILIVAQICICIYTIKNLNNTKIKYIIGGGSKHAHRHGNKLKNKSDDKPDGKPKDKSDDRSKDKPDIDKEIIINNAECISPELLMDIHNIIKRRFSTNLNFNVLNKEDKDFYERQSHILANKYNLKSSILYNQLISIRGQELSLMILHLNEKIKSLMSKIKSEFESGYDLTLIADNYKLPYIATLKQLCAKYGHSPKEIKKFLRKELPFSEKVSKLNSELDFILKNDITSSINNIDNKKRANEFEQIVMDKLDKLGIEYSTEDELRKVEENAITPDILFKKGQNIKLNGDKINWIELKNFPYYKNKLLESKIQQQAQKYYNKYGVGVFIFKLGVLSTYKHADGLTDVKFIGWGNEHASQ